MFHFDLPGLRYEPETAEKYQKVDGRLAVLPGVQSKKVKTIKGAPPLKSPFCWVVNGQKESCILTLLAKVMKCQRQAYPFSAPMVLPAVQSKKVKIIKVAPPPPVICKRYVTTDGLD